LGDFLTEQLQNPAAIEKEGTDNGFSIESGARGDDIQAGRGAGKSMQANQGVCRDKKEKPWSVPEVSPH
jgi:hypothetical protein